MSTTNSPLTENWPTNTETIICSTIDGILLLISVTISIALFTKSYQHKRSEAEIKSQHKDHISLNLFVLWGTLISCSFFVVSNIFTMLYTINSQAYICCARLITYIQIITFGIAKLLCLLIFVYRLYITFESSSALRYPNWLFYAIYAGMFLICCLIIGIVISMSIYYIAPFIYVFVVLFGLDFIGSILILLLFIKKLHKVFIQRKKHSVIDIQRRITFAEVDNQLMSTMTKLTLLSSFSALSALFLVILFIIRAIQESKVSRQTKFGSGFIWKIVYVTNVFFMFSGTINCMVEYLTLSFASHHYEKICNYPHELIERCCKFGITDKLVKDRKKWERYSKQNTESIDIKTPRINGKTTELTDV